MVCVSGDKYHIMESEWHSVFQDTYEVNLEVLSYSGSWETPEEDWMVKVNSLQECSDCETIAVRP